jgi:DNA polymerase-1
MDYLTTLQDSGSKRIAFDTETTGVRPFKGDRPFAVSMCDEHGNIGYWQWPVNPFTREVVYDDRLEEVRAILENPEWEKIGHNLIFDILMMDRIGISVKGPKLCTLIGAKIAIAEDTSYELKPMAARLFGFPSDDLDELQPATIAARRYGKKRGWKLSTWGKEPVKADYWMIAAEKADRVQESDWRWIEECPLVKRYAIGDVERTMAMAVYTETLSEERGCKSVLDREMVLLPVVIRMVKNGVTYSVQRTNDELKAAVAVEASLVRRLEKNFGKGFNVDKTADVSRALYDVLKLPVLRRTEKGKKPSTDKYAMSDYESVPAVADILDLRHVRKLTGTYLSKYHQVSVPCARNSGYRSIFASVRQVGAKTGRFACAEPNLQNIPRPPEEGEHGSPLQRAKYPFGPLPGEAWLCSDYSQIEARLFAEEASENAMIEAFIAEQDVYSLLSHKIWKDQRPEDAKKYRQRAKSVFLGRMYGLWHRSFALQQKISVDEAKQVFDDMDIEFPRIAGFMREVRQFAARHRYVVNRYGRVIGVPPRDISGENKDYVGVNYIIQSDAADLIKDAMIRVDRRIQRSGRWRRHVRMILQVHDELVIAGSKNAVIDFAPIVLSEMCSDSHWKRVPIRAEASLVESTWLSKKKLKLEAA